LRGNIAEPRDIVADFLELKLCFGPLGDQDRVARRRADLQAGINRRNEAEIFLGIANAGGPNFLQPLVLSRNRRLQQLQLALQLGYPPPNLGARFRSKRHPLGREIACSQGKRRYTAAGRSKDGSFLDRGRLCGVTIAAQRQRGRTACKQCKARQGC